MPTIDPSVPLRIIPTVSVLAAMIGRTVSVETPWSGLEFSATILDSRQVFGRTDYLIRPTDGKGEAWVSSPTVVVKGA